MRVQLPKGFGKSVDSIIAEACRSLGLEPWGGASKSGWSKQGDFQRCPRRYQLRHEIGAAPAVVGVAAPGLDIGSVGHVLLAANYARDLPDDRYPGWRPVTVDPFTLLTAIVDCGLPQADGAVVEQCMAGYLEHWGNEAFGVMAVEMQAGDAQFHTSRYDMVAVVEDGRHDGLWVVEHKFLSPRTDIEEYRMHGEILGEVLSFHLSKLDEVFGMPLEGVCLNVIFKPTKTALPRYQRLWIQPTVEALERYAQDREYWIRAMAECKRMQIWPRALQGCKTFHGLCRFFKHCMNLDDGQLILPEREHDHG